VLVATQTITEVEPWYRKALSAFESANDEVSKATTLDNLAKLLLRDPTRLGEARALAEQALAVKQTAGLDATTIRKTYEVLALIAMQQGDRAAARGYATEARRHLPTILPEGEGLRFAKSLVADTLAALRHPAERPSFEQKLTMLASRSSDLGDALRALLSGERDEAVLCDTLDPGESVIVRFILRCLADPEVERAFFSDGT